MIVLPSFFFVNKTGDLFFQGCQSHTFHNLRNKERNVALSPLTRSPCCDSECCQSHAWALDQNQVAQQTVFKLWPSVPLCCTAFAWKKKKKKKKKVLLATNAFHLPKDSLNRYSTPTSNISAAWPPSQSTNSKRNSIMNLSSRFQYYIFFPLSF